jgi:hypothetical protein
MALYVCEDCGCVENTALGQYWGRETLYPEPYADRKLCSECGSPTYTDGTPTDFGTWHGRFPKHNAREYAEAHPNSGLVFDYPSLQEQEDEEPPVEHTIEEALSRVEQAVTTILRQTPLDDDKTRYAAISSALEELINRLTSAQE